MAEYKRIFMKDLSDKLVNMFSELDFVKSVSKGDISNLPSPQAFREVLPMIFIKPGVVKNEYVNGTPETGILNQTYNFKIIYVRAVNLEDEEEGLEKILEEGEDVAQLIMERDTLDRYINESGMCLGSLVGDVDFDSASWQLFKDLKIPASLCTMDLQVYFRTKRHTVVGK